MSFPSNQFVPSVKIISSITKSNPGVVTTSEDHDYSNGLYIRLNIPLVDGMQQVNGNVYLITILSPTTFSIDQDTTNFDAFSDVSSTQDAEVIPVGEISSTLENAVKNNNNIIPEN